MNARFIVPLLIAIIATVPLAAAEAPSTQGLAAMVAGIVTSGQVIVAGVPLTSGSWGTDYITVSHALGVGRRYAVLQGNPPPADATPVMACSSQAHGIDVLILRVTSHKDQPVVEWGDPAELKSGDELMVLVRREFHPEPVKVKFLHTNLLEWSRTKPDQWPHQWHNVMVGEGIIKPGFSGSPWVRNGKVFGLLKGQVRLPGQTTWYTVAETATRVGKCLKEQHYDELVPKE